MKRRGLPDQQLAVLAILTTGTILAIGTGAAGIALIPYIQPGHGELTLVPFQRVSVLGLLLISSISYLAVLALGGSAFGATVQRRAARLESAINFLMLQGITSGGVVLTVFWSLLIGDYTESSYTRPLVV